MSIHCTSLQVATLPDPTSVPPRDRLTGCLGSDENWGLFFEMFIVVVSCHGLWAYVGLMSLNADRYEAPSMESVARSGHLYRA